MAVAVRRSLDILTEVELRGVLGNFAAPLSSTYVSKVFQPPYLVSRLTERQTDI